MYCTRDTLRGGGASSEGIGLGRCAKRLQGFSAAGPEINSVLSAILKHVKSHRITAVFDSEMGELLSNDVDDILL